MINYQIKCTDLGFDKCNFMLSGNSENELKRKFFFHIMINHSKEFENLIETQKMKIDTILKNLLDNQN